MPLLAKGCAVSSTSEFENTKLIARRWILRLGAFVSVLALAVDPFSQQLVQVEDKVTKVHDPGIGGPAYTPRADSYRRGHLFKINETSSADETSDFRVLHMKARPALSMEAAILRSVSSHSRLIAQGVDHSCTGSECTWSPFQTLAVCSRCQSVAWQLRRVKDFGEVFKYMEDLGDGDIEIHPENATAVALPNGHFLANLNGCPTGKSALVEGCEWPVAGEDTTTASSNVVASYGTSNPNNTISMQDLDTMIWSMTMLYLDEQQREDGHVPPEWNRPGGDFNDLYFNSTDPTRNDPQADLSRWPGSPVQAEECALYYCVQTIEDIFLENAFEERITEFANFTREPDSWQPRTKGSYSPENIPPNHESLEFDNEYAALEMTDLVLRYDGKSGERNSFNLSHAAIMSISAYFQETFRVPWKNESEAFDLVRERITDASVLPNGRIRSHNLYEPGSLEGLYSEGWPEMRNRISNLANGMTIEMRNTAGEGVVPSDLGSWGSGEFHQAELGLTHVSSTIYRAEWYWISLHGVIVSFGVLFCVMTMLSTSPASQDQAIWKNHSLATLRLGADIGQRHPGVTTIRDLEKTATDDKVIMLSTKAKAPLPDT